MHIFNILLVKNIESVGKQIITSGKSLNVPKWQSEDVNQRWNNAMAKGQRTNNDLQNTTPRYTEKLRLNNTNHTKKARVNSCAREGDAVPAPQVALLV
jgi:hypothetical protein